MKYQTAIETIAVISTIFFGLIGTAFQFKGIAELSTVSISFLIQALFGIFTFMMWCLVSLSRKEGEIGWSKVDKPVLLANIPGMLAYISLAIFIILRMWSSV